MRVKAGSCKSILIFLITGLFCLNLAGCSSGISSGAGAKARTLTIWHWMTDRQTAFEELAKKYEAETGVKVKFELYAPSEAYSQKVRAAAQGMNLPDIFGILAGKRDFASFINAGHVLDLTQAMDADSGKWRNSFFSNALETNEFKSGGSYNVQPGIYGVPIDTTVIQMVYNKKLYAKLGFDPAKPPASFEEMLKVAAKVKDQNIQGFVSGWGEYWMLDCFANNYAFNIMGKDKVLATIRGEVPYTDPDWISVFSIFQRMKDAGLVNNGTITMVNKTAEQLFATEKAVFAFNGSWCVNVYKSMNPNLEYGGFLPPRSSEKFPLLVWGGAGSSFMVNARSNNKEEAVRFLQWLTAEAQEAMLSERTNNLPSNKNCLKNIPDILNDFAKNMEFTTHPNIWGVTESSAVIETFDRGLQSIILGKSSPEQVAQEVQKIKEKELAKQRAK